MYEVYNEATASDGIVGAFNDAGFELGFQKYFPVDDDFLMRTDEGEVRVTEEALISSLVRGKKCSEKDAQTYVNAIRNYKKAFHDYMDGKIPGEDYIKSTIDMVIAEAKIQGIKIDEQTRSEIERVAKQYVLALEEHGDTYTNDKRENSKEKENDARDAEADRSDMKAKLKQEQAEAKQAREDLREANRKAREARRDANKADRDMRKSADQSNEDFQEIRDTHGAKLGAIFGRAKANSER